MLLYLRLLLTDYYPRVAQRADTSSLQLFEDGLIRVLLLEVFDKLFHVVLLRILLRHPLDAIPSIPFSTLDELKHGGLLGRISISHSSFDRREKSVYARLQR